MAKRLMESLNPLDFPIAEKQLLENSMKLKQTLDAGKKAECEAKGGTWDGTKCIMPVKPAPVKPTAPEVFRDEETGKLSGFILPNGQTLVGIKPDEVKSTIANFQRQAELPAGAQPGGTAQRAADARIQNQQLIDSITGQPVITEQDLLKAVPQEPTLEALQVGGAGIAGGVAGGFAGAKLGALAGTAVTPGVGTAIGAAAGALIGAIGGAYTKISLDKRGDVKQAKKVAAIAYANLGQTTDALNAGIITRDIAIKRWNSDRLSLYAARRNLQLETQKELDRFLSNGADELATVEDYISDLETLKTQEFLIALENPNPANVKYIYQNGVNLENE